MLHKAPQDDCRLGLLNFRQVHRRRGPMLRNLHSPVHHARRSMLTL